MFLRTGVASVPILGSKVQNQGHQMLKPPKSDAFLVHVNNFRHVESLPGSDMTGI